MKANANEFLTVDKLVAGDIGIISGLKHTVTGDTLVASEPDFQSACEKACLGLNVRFVMIFTESLT